MELIGKYFPSLSPSQSEKFSRLPSLYREWNAKINVISRKDIDHLAERHVLHSMAIAKFISFKEGTQVLDLGTGGGFPGIPLAIFFPSVKFHLIDSVGKKIKVVQAVAEELGLGNVSSEKARAEESHTQYDFIVTRGVASMKEIFNWSKHLISPGNKNEIQNGWILLKGGNLQQETFALQRETTVMGIADFFEEEFFTEKHIVYFR